jgi:L1 cell adhesion molecule like protein
MKNTLNDEKVSDKFTEEDKSTIEDTSKEGLQFLESNPDAAAEEYEAKQKELEAKFNPIMMRIYQAAGGAPGGAPGGMPGGMPGGFPGGGMPGAGGEMPTGGAPDAGVDDLD